MILSLHLSLTKKAVHQTTRLPARCSPLSLYPTAVKQKQVDLDNPNVPDALAELYTEMDTIATGSCIVHGYLEVRRIAFASEPFGQSMTV